MTFHEDQEDDWEQDAKPWAQASSVTEFSAYKSALKLKAGFCALEGCPNRLYGPRSCKSHTPPIDRLKILAIRLLQRLFGIY